MSQFYNVLSKRNLQKHSGKSLWQYDLSDLEFQQLKKSLIETRSLYSIDARDCTLYYAEWWKRYYNGGFPSKREVFNSIASNQFFNEEDFYQYSKRGANLLGIKWIKNQNTLYFKTLLLQGGIPINHLSNNKGSYKNFLLRILELNPDTIDDFAFDSSITSLLPFSSRNDEIYECCLEIVKAIINDKGEYLSLLENNADLKEISHELRIKKQGLRFSKRIRFRNNWVLEPGKEIIRLYLGIPKSLNLEDFKSLFFNVGESDNLDFEYKLFFNDLIICKFIKKANDKFKTIWINENDIVWDGSDQLPELKIHSLNGHQFDCQHLINYLPNLSKPTLWIKYSEAQWLLEKGRHTEQEEAYVLFPDNFVPNVEAEKINLNIDGQLMQWVAFRDTITFSDKLDSITFKTNCAKFEWFITDEKPKWILRSNMPVVKSKPKILVYDEKGNLIKQPEIKWRQNKNIFWNNWNIPLPYGIIEMQIQSGNVMEHDEFFNIGYLELDVLSNSLNEAELKLKNNNFSFQINENPLVNIEEINSGSIKLSLSSKTNIPSSIHANVRFSNQSKALRFEILPPFNGVEIIDMKQNIVENNGSFNLNNLDGHRLLSNQENLIINLYNTRKRSIIVSEQLNEKFISLSRFQDKINHLYSLSDSMDNDAEIILEIAEERAVIQRKLREYKIKRYNQTIELVFDEDNKAIVNTKPKNPDLYAIPLECTNAQLNLHYLVNNDGNYSFSTNTGLDKFIVFGSNESDVIVQPTFICLDPNNERSSPGDRMLRVIRLRDELLESNCEEEIWQRFLSYYKICLNHGLPFATFDILRAISFSSTIAAKAFVFLLCYDDTQSFADDVYKNIENDLGFSFHWINKDDWGRAMEWVGCYINADLMALVSSGVKLFFDDLYPNSNFSRISEYIMQDTIPQISTNYFLRGKVRDLRASLGVKVLNELPKECPKIPEEYKEIIGVNEDNANVKILLKSPLAVALSITGKDEILWSEHSEHICRNVIYSQQLNPEWYSEAIIYCLNKINSL